MASFLPCSCQAGPLPLTERGQGFSEHPCPFLSPRRFQVAGGTGFCFPDIPSSYPVSQSQRRETPLIPKQAELGGKDRFAMRFVKPNPVLNCSEFFIKPLLGEPYWPVLLLKQFCRLAIYNIICVGEFAFVLNTSHRKNAPVKLQSN